MAGTTKLEAINKMLIAIGEAPVNSLESGYLEAVIAESILDEVNKEVQAKGWNFNTEYNKLFAKSVAGEIVLPTNVLRVDATYTATSKDLVQRGLRMYDRGNHTYIIDEDVYLDIVVQLVWEEIPEPAKRYISDRAARKNQDRVVGSSTLHEIHMIDEREAFMDFKEFDEISDDNNIFDNYSVYRVIDRNRGRHNGSNF